MFPIKKRSPPLEVLNNILVLIGTKISHFSILLIGSEIKFKEYDFKGDKPHPSVIPKWGKQTCPHASLKVVPIPIRRAVDFRP